MYQVERILQREVVARLKHAPLDGIVVPSPNGVFIPARTPAMKNLVARIVHQLKIDGQLLPGTPDLTVLWRDGCGCIELKRPAGKTLLGKQAAGRLSDDQKAFQAACETHGIRYTVCRSWPEIRDTLVAWGRLPADWHDASSRIGRVATPAGATWH